MEMFAATPVQRHLRLHVSTKTAIEFVDITERIAALAANAHVHTGIVNIQSLHTTAAVVLNEHEPLLLADFARLLERTAPAAGRYAHADFTARTVNLVPDERRNGHAHCRALLLSPSVCLNIVDGELQLGRWQRIFFVDLDGPQPRDLSVLILGATGR
jgi:secondary thiamine-phosphate synthase enzyme